MNRNELRGLPQAALGVAAIKAQLNGKKLLWLAKDAEPTADVANFFDLIVCTDEAQTVRLVPDLFVHDAASLEDGLVIDWISVFDRMLDTLFCFNFDAIKKLRNYKLRTMNYVLGFDPATSIQDQISRVMPQADFYVLNGSALTCDGKTMQLSEYVAQKGKYGLLINLRSFNRKLMLKEWSAE